MKIRTRASIYFFIFTSLVTLSLGLFSYLIIRDITYRDTTNQLISLADIQKARIEQEIEKNIERIKGVSSRTKLRDSLKSYEEKANDKDLLAIEEIVIDARNSIDEFDEIMITNKDGMVLVSSNKIVSTNQKHSDHYKYGQNAEGIHYQINDDGEIALYGHGPLMLNGEFLGLVIIKIKPDSINKIVSDYVGLGNTGETVLAMRDDLGGIRFLHERRFEQEAQDTLTEQSLSQSLPITSALNGTEILNINISDYRQHKVWAASKYIDQTSWGLVVKIDESEALKSVNTFRQRFVIIYFLTSLIAFLSTWLLSGSISKPVRDLQNTVENFEKNGKLDIKDKSKIDEIGNLYESFLKMASKVSNNQAEMEKIVEERTDHLRKLNEAMSNRELKMAELKEEIKKLKSK